MRDNNIICYKHQLTNGLQLQFLEQIQQIYPVLNRKPVATVIKHIKDWIYLLKFHDEVWPENREINLEIYSKFQVSIFIYLMIYSYISLNISVLINADIVIMQASICIDLLI